ncbi:MAG: hypothetical protein GY811_04890, partial [Myxococcales bacterium]|nr:hypothetical protein [Myxococcales bacterium]
MHLKTLILIPVLLVGCGKQAAKPIDAAESPIDAGVTDARVDAEPDANPLCSIVGKETVAPAPEVRVISDEEIFLADTPLGIELFDVDVVGSKLVALTREGLVVVDPNTATHHRIGHNDTSSWFPGSMATTGDEIVSLWVVGPSLNEYHVCRSAVDDDTLLQSACTHIPGPKAMSQPILRPAGVVEFYGT